MAEKLITHVAVFIVLKNEAGHVLLQQRANTGYLDGYYDFACSGHVDAGESLHEAAIRELKEEIDITAKPDDLKLVHVNQNFLDKAYINFTFELDVWQGTPKICEPHKCSDLQFFDKNNLPSKCTVNVRLNEREAFASKLSYSKITPKEYDALMGEPWLA